MATGIWFLAAYNSYLPNYFGVLDGSSVSQEVLRDGAIVLLAAGAAIFAFALLGVVAACTCNGVLLVVHAVIVIILMVVQVTAVVLAIVFRIRIATKIDNEVAYMFNADYGRQDSAFTSAFNAFQSEYSCCGWRNSSDYILSELRPMNWNKTMVPEECCINRNETCTTNPTNNTFLITQGCRESLQDVLFTYGSAIIGLSIAIIGLELVHLMCPASFDLIACKRFGTEI
ncbi:hypothetical protein C0Q70_07618 [Pomacea canaliculata]|uniref:Tetraspanin n=1 Tax=Pomacea canaliculata TaxID=400727 RepID=A0A2T7PFK5_POMCA|nr:hypothetical protein C0Q70_07618 [Pomacea canaliculata]